jgi:hypothetical protein
VKQHNKDSIISAVTGRTIISNPNEQTSYEDRKKVMMLPEVQIQDSSHSALANPLDYRLTKCTKFNKSSD